MGHVTEFDRELCDLFGASPAALDALCEAKLARQPTVLRSPFSRPLFSETETYTAMVAASEAYRTNASHNPPFPPIIYVDSREQRAGREPYLPANSDGTAQQYRSRIEAKTSGLGFLFYLPEGLHYFDADGWRRARLLMRRLEAQLGLHINSIQLDCFSGRYDRTPAGIHLDGSDNFSFVIEGRKRMLFWPEDAIARKGPSSSRNQMSDILSYEHRLSDAIEIEAEVGDVIYWPRECWHIAIDPGALNWNTTVNLSIQLGARLDQLLIQAVTNAVPRDDSYPNGFPIDHQSPQQSADVVAKDILELCHNFCQHISTTSLQESVQSLWLKAFTSNGFVTLPKARQDAPPTNTALRGDTAFPAICLSLSAQDLMVGANGIVRKVPNSAAIVSLFRDLNAGKPITMPKGRESDCHISSLLTELWQAHWLTLR